MAFSMFICAKWMVEMLIMTRVNSVFSGMVLEVNVFNTDIHFISRRSHVIANRLIPGNAIKNYF